MFCSPIFKTNIFASPNIETIFAIPNQINTNKSIKFGRNNSNNQK